MDSKVLNEQWGFHYSTDDVVEQMVRKANPLPKEATVAKPKQPE